MGVKELYPVVVSMSSSSLTISDITVTDIGGSTVNPTFEQYKEYYDQVRDLLRHEKIDTSTLFSKIVPMTIDIINTVPELKGKGKGKQRKALALDILKHVISQSDRLDGARKATLLLLPDESGSEIFDLAFHNVKKAGNALSKLFKKCKC